VTATAIKDASIQQVNGVDVAALQETIAAVKENKTAGMTTWRVHSTWVGGTRTDHRVDGCTIGGEAIRRPFTIKVDEPLELCGTNQFANPQEYILAGLNACMMVGYSAVAALMGISLTRLEVEISGDIDLRGFLGIDPATPPGYRNLKQTVRIAGDATSEQFEQLHNTVKATSPNFFNLTSAVPVNSTLVVEND
jgi:uncharacterized OsmC-like protein